MRTELDGRRQRHRTGWQIVAWVVGAVSLAQLVWFGAWFFDVCRPPASGACWIGSPIPGHEGSLVAVGALAGFALVWAVAAMRRRRWSSGFAALVVAVVALGVGRWWAGPQTPFFGVWLTSDPLLLWISGVGGVLAASAIAAWSHWRSTAWAVAATMAVGSMLSVLMSLAYFVSSLE